MLSLQVTMEIDFVSHYSPYRYLVAILIKSLVFDWTLIYVMETDYNLFMLKYIFYVATFTMKQGD